MAFISANAAAPAAAREFGTGKRTPASDKINAAVAAAFMIPPAELSAKTRRAEVAHARQAAMYLAHVAYGLNFTEVGRAFGRDRTTAAHACRRIEDHREEPTFDAALTQLERVLCRDANAMSGAAS